MILNVHNNASYLGKPKAWSRAGGHFFLSNGTNEAPNNGAILNTSQIIKSVMSSATEAKLGVLYINAREAAPCQTLLKELGHKQPPTPIQTNNSTALGVVTHNILHRCLKAMDMCFWWLRDCKTRPVPLLLEPRTYQSWRLLHEGPLLRPPHQQKARVPHPSLRP